MVWTIVSREWWSRGANLFYMETLRVGMCVQVLGLRGYGCGTLYKVQKVSIPFQCRIDTFILLHSNTYIHAFF